MRSWKLAALLAALALAVTACNGEPEEDADESDPPAETGSADADGPGAELEDGVAAVVNGQEVPTEQIEEQVDSFADDPRIVEQFAGLGDDDARALIGAQVLTNAIVTVLAVDVAEELGVPVTEEDMGAARDRLEEQTGGAEELASAMEAEGLSEEQLDDQLRALAALGNIEQHLEETAAGDEPDAGAPEGGEQRAQQFLAEQLAGAEVVVNDAYGSWDAQSGQVTPPGGMPQMPAPEAAPQS